MLCPLVPISISNSDDCKALGSHAQSEAPYSLPLILYKGMRTGRWVAVAILGLAFFSFVLQSTYTVGKVESYNLVGLWYQRRERLEEQREFIGEIKGKQL